MLHVIRTSASHEDFIKLVSKLDADLSDRDGDDHAFYHQFNRIDTLKYALVAYAQNEAVGCGAIKEFDADAMEVKRMYVLPNNRGKGIATTLLWELEKWALELGYMKCVLETGKRQPEAISLYEKSGYQRIPNYGQYKGVENSICFEKIVTFGAKPPTP
jgi:GNAT superfamily N-acetyltransferase